MNEECEGCIEYEFEKKSIKSKQILCMREGSQEDRDNCICKTCVIKMMCTKDCDDFLIQFGRLKRGNK